MEVPPVFEALPIRRRELVPIGSNLYCVRGQGGSSVNIEANTAYEAFKLSGLHDAIKIERLVNIKRIILGKDQFIKDTAVPDAGGEKEPDNLLDQVIRERRQVLSPDDMIQIVAGLSAASDKPVVTDPTGVELHGDGFDEIIPSTHFSRSVVKKMNPEPEASLSILLPVNPDLETASPSEENTGKILSPEEIERLLKGE